MTALAEGSDPSDLVLAAGTLRTEQQVTEAIDAGADFLVSQALRRATGTS